MFIKNEIVLLRPLQEQDLEPFYTYRNDPEICRYQDFMVKDYAHARSFIAKQKNITLTQPEVWMQVAIARADNNKLVGDCAVKFSGANHKIAEIGCTISGEYQRKGYGKAGIKLLLEFLFTKRSIHKVIAHIDHRNMPSLRLIHSLGFHQDGLLRKNFFENGTWHDEFLFSMLGSEFAEK